MSELSSLLLVEDTPSDARLTQELLRGAAVNVKICQSMAETLAALEAQVFDVALVDLGLPDSRGLETFRGIRDAAPALPVIVLTGLDDEQIGLDAVREGAQDFLSKDDIDSKGLLRAMRHAQERMAVGRRLERVNQLLRATRTINQLVAAEQDPIALARKACERLVATRGYQAAWLFVNDLENVPRFIEHAQYGPRIEEYRARIEGGEWVPTCYGAAAKCEGPIVVPEAQVCMGCAVHPGGRAKSEAMVCTLRHAGRPLGTLGVRGRRGIGDQREERDFLAEVAGDLGLALHAIDEAARRQRSDAELRQREAELEAIYDNSPMALMLVDAEHRIRKTNHLPGVVEPTGSPEDTVGLVTSCLHLAGSEVACGKGLACESCPVRKTLAEVLRSGEAVREIQLTLPTLRDGLRATNYLLLSARRVRIGDEMLALLAVSDDRQRRLAEEMLREQRDFAETLVETAPVVVAVLDANGTVRRANRHLEQLCERPIRTVLGRPLDVLIPDSERARWREALARWHQSALPAPHVSHLETARGDRRTIEWAGVRLAGGRDEEAAVLVVGLDITARATTEQALRDSERRFRLFFQRQPEYCYALGPDLTIRDANQAAVQALGYSRQELLGRGIRDVYTADSHDTHDRAFDDWAQTGRISNLELQLQTRSGEQREVLVSMELVHREDGSPDQYLVIQRDVSELRLLKDQLLQSQKMEAIGQLAGGVAHDFNNLLTVILSTAEMMGEDLRPQDPLQEDIGQIKSAAERAATLTRQLLAFSRKQMFRLEVTDPNTLVVELQRLLGRLIGENIRVVTHLPPDVGHVHVDRGQIEQVIMNLAVNARDAMPDGGTLVLETSRVTIDDAHAAEHVGAAPGEYVRISVTDTGTGIAPEILDRIFEPFFSTKPQGKGTGLGLATVYGIVKQHGGSVWVYSELAVGTTFKIYLPVWNDQGKRAGLQDATPRHAARARGNGETILLVEDAEPVRRLAARALTRRGFNVILARDGIEALAVEASHDGPIHLVLTDMIMPGLTGRETAARLLERRPDTPVLFMSGYSDNAIATQGILDPGVPFIQKPFRPNDLVQRVLGLLAD